MGLIRLGDPIGFPEIDTMTKRGIKYELDSVWRHRWEADKREMQLSKDGKVVYLLDRYAPPEEVKSHLPTRGIEGIDNYKVHLDGRYTPVVDVWVAIGRTYRKKVSSRPKIKKGGYKPSEYTKDVLQVTKAAMLGTLGMGVVAGIGAALRKKSRRSKPKVKKCGCKK